MSRPEHENPPDIYYNQENATHYHVNSRIRRIQRKMAERAVELLNLPVVEDHSDELGLTGTASVYGKIYKPCHVLDIGCGTCISSDVISCLECAFEPDSRVLGNMTFTGVDISRDMLKIAKQREAEEETVLDEDLEAYNSAEEAAEEIEMEDDVQEEIGHATVSANTRLEDCKSKLWREVLQVDIGKGLPFRPGSFDACVSISVVQWLCHVNSRHEDSPQRKMRLLFQSLYNCLKRGAKAVFQFYPENAKQINMISEAAMRCGFRGGLVVDFPHSTRAKKYYLVLSAGIVDNAAMTIGVSADALPRALGEDSMEGSCSDSEQSEERNCDPYNFHVLRTKAKVGSREGRNRHAVAARERNKKRLRDNRPVAGTKEWVLMKKEKRRQFGLEVHPNTKYSTRKRKPRF